MACQVCGKFLTRGHALSRKPPSSDQLFPSAAQMAVQVGPPVVCGKLAHPALARIWEQAWPVATGLEACFWGHWAWLSCAAVLMAALCLWHVHNSVWQGIPDNSTRLPFVAFSGSGMRCLRPPPCQSYPNFTKAQLCMQIFAPVQCLAWSPLGAHVRHVRLPIFSGSGTRACRLHIRALHAFSTALCVWSIDVWQVGGGFFGGP